MEEEARVAAKTEAAKAVVAMEGGARAVEMGVAGTAEAAAAEEATAAEGMEAAAAVASTVVEAMEAAEMAVVEWDRPQFEPRSPLSRYPQ